MTTITASDAQPWWVNHNATYAAVYYARTIARIWRAMTFVPKGDNARDLTY